MTDQHVQRALLLLEQGRSHDAAAEARRALALEPNHAMALGILATCNLMAKEFAKGLELARQAVANDAEHPWLLLVLARAQFYTYDVPAAKETLQTGLQNMPDYAPFWALLGEIEMYGEQWAKALEAADQGLQFDPSDVDLINLRSRALVKLNRTGEAAETLAHALNQAPEDPYSHANKGWVMVEQGRFDDAIASFREALRLNPNLEHARTGLKEAIKGKNPLYRMVLNYFLWMGKMQSGTQWLIIIGIYLGGRVLRRMSDMGGIAGVIGMALLALYVIFVYSTWIARPIGDLFLRLHPVGKLALDDDEIKATNWTGGLLGLTIVLFLASAFAKSDQDSPLTLAALLCLTMLIPVGGLFSVPEGTTSRRNLTWYAMGLAACAVLGLTLFPMCLLVYGIGLFTYGWVANYVTERESKRFR